MLDPKLPMRAAFTLENNGMLDIENIRFETGIDRVWGKDRFGIENMTVKHRDDAPAIERLEPNHQATVWLTTGIRGAIESAEVALIVTYKPRCWREQTEIHSFKTIRTASGEFVWQP